MIKRQTLKAPSIRTLDWYKNKPIDWNSAGTQYQFDGTTNKLQKYHFGFACDAAISSKDGVFALVYKRLGTKGILLKNGEVHREINRSFYQSEVYEFPAAFFDFNGKTYLAHCPNGYDLLDFEDAETGEIITNIDSRTPPDIFHSRLEVSPNQQYLISKAWVWHPFEYITAYDIKQCFSNPDLLDKGMEVEFDEEINTASFIDDDNVLIGSTENNTLAIWNLKKENTTANKKINAPFGNCFAINHQYCWDMYEYPKIIDLTSGEIVAEEKHVFSGKQCSSIIHHLEEIPQIVQNRNTNQIAIAHNNTIEVLTFEL